MTPGDVCWNSFECKQYCIAGENRFGENGGGDIGLRAGGRWCVLCTKTDQICFMHQRRTRCTRWMIHFYARHGSNVNQRWWHARTKSVNVTISSLQPFVHHGNWAKVVQKTSAQKMPSSLSGADGGVGLMEHHPWHLPHCWRRSAVQSMGADEGGLGLGQPHPSVPPGLCDNATP